MKQLKKTLLTLVALLAVTTGAWATDTYTVTFAANGNTKTVENVTLPKNFQCSYSNADGELDLILKELYGWTGDSGETVCANWSTPKSSDANKVVAAKDNDGHYITIDNVFEGTVTITGDYYVNTSLTSYSLEISIAAVPVTPVDIAWDATAKTATIAKMPAGNVTVSVDYYPQATADGAVTAATDAKATTDAPLVTVDATQLTGAAKMMYYASTSTTAPDYDAEGWSDKVPTAEKFTEAGNVNVWYYPVGTDEGVGGATATYSDGDMNATALAVTLLPEPTYDVTFADGVNPDPAKPEWTATPNTGVKKGQTVTVTYTGDRKVIGVKAEKKPVAEGHALSASAVGEIVGTDGKAYAAADKDNLPSGVTAVAMIAYVGNGTDHATYTHGLAIALADESNSKWSTAKSTCEGKSAVTNAAWLLPSQNQWKAMFSANGGNEGQYTDLNTAITTAGGTALQGTPPYWSSTPSEFNDGTAYNVLLGGSGAEWYRDYYDETRYRVRACLAF